MNARTYRGVTFASLIFLLVQLGALALVPTFYQQGYQTVEDPTNPTNSVVYIVAILVATAFMLAAFKYNLDQVVRAVIIFTSGMLGWYVFSVLVPPLVAVVPAVAIALGLLVHPEWYVIDAAGVVMGAGAAGLFGISFGLLPALVLLSILAVYDAISVYGTEHMLDLAEGVMDLHLPVVLVIPLSFSYSLLADDFGLGGDGDDAAERDDDSDAEATDDAGDAAEDDGDEVDDSDDADDATGDPSPIEERDAFFIGLGDAVIPAVLVASAAFFSSAPSLGVPGVPALNLPAAVSMLGTFVGLLFLLRMVFKGRAHAGLPLLNGGAIGGYLLGATLAGIPLVEALGLAPYV